MECCSLKRESDKNEVSRAVLKCETYVRSQTILAILNIQLEHLRAAFLRRLYFVVLVIVVRYASSIPPGNEQNTHHIPFFNL
jgi:hypothetical protein